MMQTPVRYYITKDHDQPVVLTIPVAVPTVEQPRPAPQEFIAIQVPTAQPAPARTRVKSWSARLCTGPSAAE